MLIETEAIFLEPVWVCAKPIYVTLLTWRCWLCGRLLTIGVPVFMTHLPVLGTLFLFWVASPKALCWALLYPVAPFSVAAPWEVCSFPGLGIWGRREVRGQTGGVDRKEAAVIMYCLRKRCLKEGERERDRDRETDTQRNTQRERDAAVQHFLH